jgi:hypothetical protein
MKSFFVSRSVVPLFATVALLVSILSLSISSTTLYALEQSNPVLLALGTFRHTHHLDGSNSDYSEASQLQLHSNDMKVVVLGTGSESPESPSNTPQQEQPHQQQQSLPLQDFYPFEDPIPNPEPADGYNTFSACMVRTGPCCCPVRTWEACFLTLGLVSRFSLYSSSWTTIIGSLSGW